MADLENRLKQVEDKIKVLERKIQKYSAIDEWFDRLIKGIHKIYGEDNKEKKPPTSPKPPEPRFIKERDLGPKENEGKNEKL